LPWFPVGNLVVSSEWAYLSRSETTLAPANVAPTVTNGLYAGGAARWRGNSSLAWRNGPWSATLAGYYTGRTHDTGATVTAAQYEALGRPDYVAAFFNGSTTVYRRVVDPVWSYNLTVGYTFRASAPSWLRGTKLRLGAVNLTDVEPPLTTSEGFGYDATVNQTLLPGRTWTVEVTRTF
jgi:outer membrane receptor protein involved in Fe transport